MKLIYHPASPYARKVRVAAIELNLAHALELVHVDLTLGQYNPEVGLMNPTGKVPVAVTYYGETLYDSHVICEYLDSLAGGSLIIPDPGPSRWPVLRMHALSDEIIAAGQLLRQEALVRAPEHVSDGWMALQLSRIERGLDAAEASAAELRQPVNLGQIGLACAIGWLEFRQLGGTLRQGREYLFQWYEEFAQRPSMLETAPRDSA